MREKQSRQLAFRTSPTLLSQIEQEAEQDRRTVADMCRVLLMDAIAARRSGQHVEERAA